MKISIIGLGFVGSAMLKSFQEKDVNIIGVYDKFKEGGIGSLDSCLEADIIFSALPTVYHEDLKEYDKRPLFETLDKLEKMKFQGLFVVKSTVEPGTCQKLSENYSFEIAHNPEFLTARTAYEDFHHQEHIVLGTNNQNLIKFYETYYPNAKISVCTTNESESMKIFCNCFYAVKVQFFNEIFLICQKMGMNYENILEMMLKNGWIHPMHTKVPGPDGKLSYGGLCFPKDTNALNYFMEKNNLPHKVLEATIEERNEMRNDHENCNLNFSN